MKLQRFLSDNFSTGKGSIKIPIAESIAKYRRQYEELRKHTQFKYDVYYLMPGGRPIVHVKVPSESLKSFYYDVIIEFGSSSVSNKLSGQFAKNFEDCHVKIFSNSPSFVYNYAYVFYHLKDDELGSENMIIDKFNEKIPKDRLLVKGTEKKLGEEPLTQAPDTRNALKIPLFDKTVYYAVFFIMDNLDFNRTVYNKRAITERQLLTNISDFDTLMAKRKQQEQKERDAKATVKKAETKTFEDHEKKLAKANSNTITHKNTNVRKIGTPASNNVRKVTRRGSGNVNKIG